MTLAGDTQVRFSEAEQQELEEYQPLNRFALVAGVLGWGGVVALIHPLLCAVPILGALSAIVALRQFRLPECKQSGYKLAVMGLIVSLLFGSWGGSRELSRQLRLYGQARQFAESWLDRIREGHLYEAHQLTLKEAMRAAPGVSLEKHYVPKGNKMEDMRKARESGKAPEEMNEMMEPTPAELFDVFFNQEVPKRLRELGNRAQFQFQENVRIGHTSSITEQVDLIFSVSEAGSSGSFPVKISLEREFQAGVADWNVSNLARPQQ